MRSLVTRVLGLAIVCSASWFSQAAQPQSSPKVRNDYVAAAEVDWHYPPGGVMLWEKNSSGYINPNIHTFTSDPKGVKKFEFSPGDEEGNFASTGSGFTVAHPKFSSNGYIDRLHLRLHQRDQVGGDQVGAFPVLPYDVAAPARS